MLPNASLETTMCGNPAISSEAVRPLHVAAQGVLMTVVGKMVGAAPLAVGRNWI